MAEQIQTVKDWYAKFGDTLENTFPNMDGYVAHNNIKWLIETVERQQREIKKLERVNLAAIHLMTDKQLDKLKQFMDKYHVR